MSGNPRHVVLRGGVEIGAFFDLPWQGLVSLHTDDPELTEILVESGAVIPPRAPFLDATGEGVHGAYRPRGQLNLFFEPPLAAVVEAIRPTLEAAGFAVATPEPAP
ncbi:MAG TPA: hypothetical protein VM778_08575 [Gemmatimonadota bacterium]|nr:hypothetical protein [Gemmatimonadota bacterium]